MDKEIREFDRLKIGVREWAVREAVTFAIAFKDTGHVIHEGNLNLDVNREDVTWGDIILGAAKDFEGFVLRKIEN